MLDPAVDLGEPRGPAGRAALGVLSHGRGHKTRLFSYINYFAAEDRDVALELWDYLADWYAVETGLNNSTLLEPIDKADYVFVLRANRVGVMPSLYRLA